MKTATNTALVHFNDGQIHKYKTDATIPEIRKKFQLGKRFYTDDEINQIEVTALTIF